MVFSTNTGTYLPPHTFCPGTIPQSVRIVGPLKLTQTVLAHITLSRKLGRR